MAKGPIVRFLPKIFRAENHGLPPEEQIRDDAIRIGESVTIRLREIQEKSTEALALVSAFIFILQQDIFKEYKIDISRQDKLSNLNNINNLNNVILKIFDMKEDYKNRWMDFWKKNDKENSFIFGMCDIAFDFWITEINTLTSNSSACESIMITNRLIISSIRYNIVEEKAKDLHGVFIIKENYKFRSQDWPYPVFK